MSASTTSAAGSPSLTAAAALVMQGGTGLTPQGGLGLGLTPLGMGMGSSSLVHGLAGMSQAEQEEERTRRLEVIKEMIGAQAAGLVSQEGVERAARKVGLECLWEEGMGIGDKRVLSIAGSGLLIEVDFQGDAIAAVGLSFPASKEGEDGVGRFAKKGSEVLKKDLIGNGKQDYVYAGDFLANLQRLAKMDQLGGDDVSCFDAVDGIFKCLERIYQREVSNVKDKGKVSIEYEVMCNHSGRPLMHGERRVGLGLQYWIDQRLVAQEIDDTEGLEINTEEAINGLLGKVPTRMWTIMVECEESPAQLNEGIKVSDQWVSNNVEKPAKQELDAVHISLNQIDWLDVKDSGLANGKVPDVRFVARFEPTVLLPLQLAMQVHQSLNSAVDQSAIIPATYEAHLFAELDAQNGISTNPRTAEHSLGSTHSGKPRKVTFTLFNQSQDIALAISEVPFKHPMQIVNLLPVLRQWALVSSILRRSFTPRTQEDKPSNPDSRTGKGTNGSNASPPKFQTLEEELAEFLASPSTNGDANDASSAVEISFITSPLPRFTVHFQNPKFGGKLASVAFSIGLNGAFEGVEVDDGRPPPENVDNTEEATNLMMKLREKTRKVLDISESIGVLIEWLSE